MRNKIKKKSFLNLIFTNNQQQKKDIILPTLIRFLFLILNIVVLCLQHRRIFDYAAYLSGLDFLKFLEKSISKKKRKKKRHSRSNLHKIEILKINLIIMNWQIFITNYENKIVKIYDQVYYDLLCRVVTTWIHWRKKKKKKFKMSPVIGPRSSSMYCELFSYIQVWWVLIIQSAAINFKRTTSLVRLPCTIFLLCFFFFSIVFSAKHIFVHVFFENTWI